MGAILIRCGESLTAPPLFYGWGVERLRARLPEGDGVRVWIRDLRGRRSRYRSVPRVSTDPQLAPPAELEPILIRWGESPTAPPFFFGWGL